MKGGNPGLTVVIQGQGQTTGQLQVIPQGVTVIPGPGQQLMQAAMPNGQVQRFLFTPVPPTTPAATVSTPSTSVTPASSSASITAGPTTPARPGKIQDTSMKVVLCIERFGVRQRGRLLFFFKGNCFTARLG